MKTYNTIDEYIADFPKDIQEIMIKLRAEIHSQAPGVVETMAYKMPTFKLNGKNLVHFAGWKSHIGFYPTPSAIDEFKNDFKKYKTSKGAIQFPLSEPIPFNLVRKIVKYRIEALS